jgi:propionyl-CoA carboxylase alpha chain
MKMLVSVGDKITAGQDLAIIEAMKMENTLTASVEGTVSRIVANAGDSLAVDAVIIEFE